MPKLEFLIGYPRSGKTCFSKRWKTEHPNGVVLSGDSFRLSIYQKRYQTVGEELVKATMITAARALLISGYDVLIDETNTTITNINSILAIDKNAKAYLFTTPLEVCIERAKLTNQPDLIPVLYRMEKNLSETQKALENGSLVLNNIEVVV